MPESLIPSTQSTQRADELIRENVQTITQIKKQAEWERTTGEKVADGFARVVGSWPFIMIQSVLLAAWVTANVMRLVKPWDPYPFILLNLALSFQAAYASPIIMMSQNRQARLSDERNHLALQVALLEEQEDTNTLRMLRKICDRLKIPLNEITEKILEEATDPKNLISHIKEAEEPKKN